MPTLAARIKASRIKRGLTVRELAKKVGLKEPYYMFQLEKAERKITKTKYLLPIAKALKVDPEWLLQGDTLRTLAPVKAVLSPEAELTSRNKAISALCEEQQAKIEALLADNATMAEAKGKLSEELEALRDENIALAKEAINAATEPTVQSRGADPVDKSYRELVHKLRTAIRWARLSDNEWINFRVLEDILGDANV